MNVSEIEEVQDEENLEIFVTEKELKRVWAEAALKPFGRPLESFNVKDALLLLMDEEDEELMGPNEEEKEEKEKEELALSTQGKKTKATKTPKKASSKASKEPEVFVAQQVESEYLISSSSSSSSSSYSFYLSYITGIGKAMERSRGDVLLGFAGQGVLGPSRFTSSGQ